MIAKNKRILNQTRESFDGTNKPTSYHYITLRLAITLVASSMPWIVMLVLAMFLQSVIMTVATFSAGTEITPRQCIDYCYCSHLVQ